MLKPRLLSIIGEHKESVEDVQAIRSANLSTNYWSEDEELDLSEQYEENPSDPDSIVGDLSEDDLSFIEEFRDDF